MISSIVRVTEKYRNSGLVSIQQEHIDLFVNGKLAVLELFMKETNEQIAVYKGEDLARLVASAIANGRRKAINSFSGDTEYYWLGNRD